MKFPYKETALVRATVVRQARLVLPRETDASADSYRLVQLLTPKAVYIGFEGANPADNSGGRDYNMLYVPAGFSTIAPFPMLPDQELYMLAAAEPGAELPTPVLASLIVQFWQKGA